MIESSSLIRAKISLGGLLQGVGFRPYVHKLANEMGLKGLVYNTPQGISIEIEGALEMVEEFSTRLQNESPPNSSIQNLKSSFHKPLGYKNFEIRPSDYAGEQSAQILPDIATCSDCYVELFAPSNRRYLYPFINCTHCGPRFSIMEAIPYDRINTSMKQFEMCETCQAEYDDPNDRRFHAQPNACPKCGPSLELYGSSKLCIGGKALKQTATVLKKGSIVAIKGLGGFHLTANACDDLAVQKLRVRKNREAKPLAVMFSDISEVKKICEISPKEEQLLLSREAPIVILKRIQKIDHLSKHLAPSNPYLGVMLPSNPLHHILMHEMDCPIVATSGNVSDETICIENEDAFNRLTEIADFFLIHNRPIVRHVDDSIVRVVLNDSQILRRARGYAPLPITLKDKIPPFKATGGYLKNTIALAKGHNIFVSQHIGDLGNEQTASAFESTIKSLEQLSAIHPSVTACDFHPDYPSTHYAEKLHGLTLPVQHHVAHVFSCMAEHNLEGPLLGVAWDGSGYGLDGTIWGGEFFHITEESIHRVACWSPFPLPGGDKAIIEPRRSALGLLYKVLGDSVFDQPEILKYFSSEELSILKTMLDKNINCPMTSSCGRIFDAVSSMLGIRQTNSFEGQAAMDLEFSILDPTNEGSYTVDLIEGKFKNSKVQGNQNYPSYYDLNLQYQLDETAMTLEILSDIKANYSTSLIAAKFHNMLAESIVAVAKRVGEERVLLSGGCFQNIYLTQRTVHRLNEEGYHPYWHKRIPPNDGGLAVGQLYAASRFEKNVEVANVPCGSR
jgi:hydrogenase maturation protein HypF